MEPQTTLTSPLLNQDSESPLIVPREQKATGWTTQAKKVRRIIIPPHHLMDWVHDTVPHSPIPPDAVFRALGVDGPNGRMGFEFTSDISPASQGCYFTFAQLLQFLRNILKSRIPANAEVSGIHLSNIWTHMMIEVQSDGFSDANPLQGELPIINVRYEGGKLIVVDNSQKNMAQEQRLTEEIIRA